MTIVKLYVRIRLLLCIFICSKKYEMIEKDRWKNNKKRKQKKQKKLKKLKKTRKIKKKKKKK